MDETEWERKWEMGKGTRNGKWEWMRETDLASGCWRSPCSSATGAATTRTGVPTPTPSGSASYAAQEEEEEVVKGAVAVEVEAGRHAPFHHVTCTF